MAAIEWEITSGYDFTDIIHLGMCKSICTLNFDEISQSTADGLNYYYIRFAKTDLCRFGILQINNTRQSYEFISILFKMAAIDLEIYFRLRF